jgi:uncharacterized protein (TIGR02996 family)
MLDGPAACNEDAGARRGNAKMDEDFLEALAARPADNVARLVYADWLQERDDPRAEFLRLEVQLAGGITPVGDRGELATRLAELGRTAEPGWLLAVNRVPFARCRLEPRGPGAAAVELANYSARVLTVAYDAHPMQYLGAAVTDPINREWECRYESLVARRPRGGQLRLFPGERYSVGVDLLGAVPASELLPGRYAVKAAYEYDGVRSRAEPVTLEVTEEERRRRRK